MSTKGKDSSRRSQPSSFEKEGLSVSAYFPVNIEKLLLEASMDESLLDALLTNRVETLRQSTFKLSEAELEMFLSIPESTLIEIANRMAPDSMKRKARKKL